MIRSLNATKAMLLLSLLVMSPLGATAKPNILVLGDSLSAAHGIDTADGWVNLLRTRLTNQHYDYDVVNASISGETTDGGLARLPQLLDAHRPALVVIELGANDGLRATQPEHIKANLMRLVALSQDHGAQVLLLGVRLPPNYGSAYTEQFTELFQAVAERKRLAWVPHLLQGIALHRGLMQADGLHPKARAEPMILDNIWPVLKPLLGPPSDTGV